MKSIKTILATAVLPLMLAAQSLSSAPQNDDPFAAMLQLQREMDAAMARFHERMMRNADFGDFMSLHAMMPRVDLVDKGDRYVLSMEIPGADKQSIDIHTENGILTVTAKREEVREDKNDTYVRHERSVSSYARSVMLPADADAEHLKSDYKNGVLTVTVPKKKL